jgi:hypothetical protein
LVGEAFALAVVPILKHFSPHPPEFLRPFGAIPYWVFDAFNFWVGLWGIGPLVRDWMLRLWPNVEFAFGHPHLREEEDKRGQLRFVMAMIVLPLVISLVTLLIQASVK